MLNWFFMIKMESKILLWLLLYNLYSLLIVFKCTYLSEKFERDMELYWGQSNKIKGYNFMVCWILVNLSCFPLRFWSVCIRKIVNHAALLGFLPILSKGGIQISVHKLCSNGTKCAPRIWLKRAFCDDT